MSNTKNAQTCISFAANKNPVVQVLYCSCSSRTVLAEYVQMMYLLYSRWCFSASNQTSSTLLLSILEQENNKQAGKDDSPCARPKTNNASTFLSGKAGYKCSSSVAFVVSFGGSDPASFGQLLW